MNRIKQLLAITVSIILLLSCLACKRPDSGAQGDAPITLSTNAPDAPETEAAATPDPSLAFTTDEAVADAFDALDKELFCWHATMDGFSFHMLVADPVAMGIDPASVPMTFGEFTEEDSKRIAAEANVFLTRLLEIDREKLDEQRQFSYDVAQQTLEDYANSTIYEYLYEPLTEYSGLHSNMPLNFALLKIEDERDVEDYLTLLSDLPRYYGQVLAYEQKRAELGIFMTEGALDGVLEDCKTLIDAKDTIFLIGTFADAIDKLDSLTEEQKAAYRKRNEEILKNEFVDAYETLYNGLNDLRKDCREYEGVCRLGNEHKDYFAYCVSKEGNNQLSVEEALELLRDEYDHIHEDFVNLVIHNQDLAKMNDKITSGDMERDLDELKKIASQILPELPTHTLTLEDVPEELEQMFPPAAYVKPAVDEWRDNTVFINLAQPSDTLFLTLAHEAYPGHMYQYVYQRGLEGVSLLQKTLHLGAYAEGWSQLSEYMVSQNQTVYQADYVQFTFDYAMMINALVPSICSILVNYYDYDREALTLYIDGLGLIGTMVCELFYPIVIDQPYYFFEYGIGYAQLSQLMRNAQEDLGETFELSAFLKAYLDLGPGYFNLVQERMDVWVDERMQDVAAA